MHIRASSASREGAMGTLNCFRPQDKSVHFIKLLCIELILLQMF